MNFEVNQTVKFKTNWAEIANELTKQREDQNRMVCGDAETYCIDSYDMTKNFTILDIDGDGDVHLEVDEFIELWVYAEMLEMVK